MKLTAAPAVSLAQRGVPYPDFKIVESKGFGDFSDAKPEARFAASIRTVQNA